MPLQEIERKFLVAGDFRQEASGSSRIRQGFLCAEPGRTVRVRVYGDRGYITVKGPAKDLVRFEWEKEIPVEEAKLLLRLCLPGQIDKTRWLVPAPDGHVWEVDEFHGANDGLVVAEIELGAADELFERPAWVGKEVTGVHRYANSRLIQHPYTEWKQNDN